MLTRLRSALGLTVALASHFFSRFAFFSVIAFIALWPLLSTAGRQNEARDAQFLQAYEQHAVETIRHYGQVPLWDPYSYGGLYAFGTAQTRFAAPTVLLSLALGPYRAIVVIAYLLTLLGMEGAFRYLRERGGASFGCALAAPLFGLTGYFASAYFWGWLWFFGALLTPWALYGVARAVRGHPGGAIVAAVVFMFLFGFGAAYVIPITALLCAVEVVRCVAERRFRAPFHAPAAALGCAVLLALGLSAYRLWPMLDFMAVSPRIMAGAPSHSLLALAKQSFVSALDPSQEWEGLAYVGTMGGPIILIGVIRRRSWGALIILLLLIWTATGYAFGTSPFVWLRDLPVFSSLRYPERYLPFAFLFALEILAVGVNTVTAFAFRRAEWIALLPIALVAANAVQLAKNYRFVVSCMDLATPPERFERPFKQARGNRWAMAHYGPLQRGSLGCAEGTPLPQSEHVRGDLREEHYLLESDAGEVESLAWSPERLDYRASLGRSATLIINQNYHPGWHSSVGTVHPVDGLLGVDLPAGTSNVRLRFLPRSALAGSIVTLLALAAATILTARLRAGAQWKNKRAAFSACALAAIPLPIGAAAAQLIHEPPIPTPVLRNADGQPVILDELPPTATAIGARFDLPVEIVGASVAATEQNDEVPIEIYFRVSGVVPRSVGVFVHVEGPKRMQADHDVVGASLFFSDAPPGKILRDAFTIRPEHIAGDYRVYVGLWRTSGNGSRVGVQSTDQLAGPADGRVQIGAFHLEE